MSVITHNCYIYTDGAAERRAPNARSKCCRRFRRSAVRRSAVRRVPGPRFQWDLTWAQSGSSGRDGAKSRHGKMVRRKKKEQTSLWAQLLILFTVMSFRRSKLGSLAAVLSSSRRRRNGATAVGETVLAGRLRQCEPASGSRKISAQKSERPRPSFDRSRPL